MKLFGGKKGDEKSAPATDDSDFNDSPVETVSLSDPRPSTQRPARASAAAQTAPAPVEETHAHYGIEQAITLMRALPMTDNVELVVQVIKTTLESLKVRVSDIIADASRKEKDLKDRVEHLQREIVDFDKEISQRRETIAKLEADHAETSSVKARLEMAEKSQRAQAATPDAAARPQAKIGGK